MEYIHAAENRNTAAWMDESNHGEIKALHNVIVETVDYLLPNDGRSSYYIVDALQQLRDELYPCDLNKYEAEVGINFKNARESSEMSIIHVGSKLNVPTIVIENWESLESPIPLAKVVEASRLFGINLIDDK